MKALLAILAVTLLTIACGDTAAPAAANSPVAQATPTPPPSQSPSVMTKDSGIDGVPLPSDAVAKPDGTSWSSGLGTIAEYTSFYRDWGPKHGWIIDAPFSFSDPSVGVAKQAGYGTDTTLCVPNSSPIRTVIILVGSPNGKTDQGKLTTIQVIDSPNESSCP